MKTEQEIIEIANKLTPILDSTQNSSLQISARIGFKEGYTQAQDDMQAELEKLKAELQEAKNDAMLDNTIIENLKKEIWTIKSKLVQKIASIQDDYNSMDDKCALLEKAHADVVVKNKELEDRLQEAEDDALTFQKYLHCRNMELREINKNGELVYMNRLGIIWFGSELYKHYEQSKTQDNEKGTTM